MMARATALADRRAVVDSTGGEGEAWAHAEEPPAIDDGCGVRPMQSEGGAIAEDGDASELDLGDPALAQLGKLVRTHSQIEKARVAASQRGLPAVAADLERLEERLERQITAAVQKTALAGWLPFGGVQVARLLALIGNPWRFPGRPCAAGHIVSERYEGETCYLWTRPEPGVWVPCGAALGERRRGSGVRSLWHYAGLSPDGSGRLLRRRKGVQASYRADLKTTLLMPQGIVDQLIMRRVEPYRSLYERAKARFEEGGAEAPGEADSRNGSALHRHRKARVLVAKAFLGDLLTAWKAAS
jgi:hypothetical protein